MKKRKLLLILSAACLLCAICSVGCTPTGNSATAPKQDGSAAEIDDTLVQDKTDTGDDEKNGPSDTPQEPSEPKNPDTGGEKEDTTPDKDPDVEEPNPEVPDPDPEEPGPEEPDTPDTPENPDESDTPENPDEPDAPKEPDNPDKPEEPEKPDPEPDPDTPKDPDETDEPADPDEPEKPDPDTPTDPDPDEPEKPDPEDPEIPEEPHLFPAALVGTYGGADVYNIAYIVEISPDSLTVFIDGEEAFVADVGYDAESGAVTLTLNGLPCTMTLTGEGLLLTSSDFFTFNVTLTRTA